MRSAATSMPRRNACYAKCQTHAAEVKKLLGKHEKENVERLLKASTQVKGPHMATKRGNSELILRQYPLIYADTDIKVFIFIC